MPFIAMRLKLVTLIIALLDVCSTTGVLRTRSSSAVPRRWPFNLTKRNDTSVATAKLMLNVDPDIDAPMCGAVYPVSLNVKSQPDPFYLSGACQKLLGCLGASGSIKVDLIFVCPGVPTQGIGDRSVKAILDFATSNIFANDGEPSSPNLEVAAEDENLFISTGVTLGTKMKGNVGVVQFLYC
jgi:hypothetical protein